MKSGHKEYCPSSLINTWYLLSGSSNGLVIVLYLALTLRGFLQALHSLKYSFNARCCCCSQLLARRINKKVVSGEHSQTERIGGLRFPSEQIFLTHMIVLQAAEHVDRTL